MLMSLNPVFVCQRSESFAKSLYLARSHRSHFGFVWPTFSRLIQALFDCGQRIHNLLSENCLQFSLCSRVASYSLFASPPPFTCVHIDTPSCDRLNIPSSIHLYHLQSLCVCTKPDHTGLCVAYDTFSALLCNIWRPTKPLSQSRPPDRLLRWQTVSPSLCGFHFERFLNPAL